MTHLFVCSTHLMLALRKQFAMIYLELKNRKFYINQV